VTKVDEADVTQRLNQHQRQEDLHVPFPVDVVCSWLVFWLRGGGIGFPNVRLSAQCHGDGSAECVAHIQAGGLFERSPAHGARTITANVHLFGDCLVDRCQHVLTSDQARDMEVLSPGVVCIQHALCFHLLSIDERLTELNLVLTTPVALPLYERILGLLQIRGAWRLQSIEAYVAGTGAHRESDDPKKALTHTLSTTNGVPMAKPGRPRSKVDDEAGDRVEAGESKEAVYRWWKEAASRENPHRLESSDSTPEELFNGVLKRRKARNKQSSTVPKYS
jgi:hypothetical protein